ncbi:MAG TPA: glycosyltransferase [Ktedonobacteraceae bacterium]|nr:glycosyltransferase [Ktedonobacteraceae bacterium]
MRRKPDAAPLTSQVNTPIKVCLHVLRDARYDTRAMREAVSLTEAGFEVKILDVVDVPAHPGEEKTRGFCMQHMLVPDWQTARKSELRFFLKSVRLFLSSCRQLLLCPADVYHASELTALPACYIVAKLRRKPLIFEVYDLQFPAPATGVKFWGKLGGLLDYIQGWMLPRCAGVIATSPLHAEELRKRYHVTDITLVRNVPLYCRATKNDRLHQHLGLSPKTHVVLYQGGLQPGRGLELLIAAAAYLHRDIVIVMMGQDMLGTRSKLEAQISSQNVADRVKIIPAVPYEELLQWTASADIGITILPPSYSLNVRTCLPNKFFEYLMASLPVLSSPVPAIVEVVKQYDVGCIIPSLAPKDVGDAINTMLEDQEALLRMRENTGRAARECCWEEDSVRLISLYQKTLNDKHVSS